MGNTETKSAPARRWWNPATWGNRKTDEPQEAKTFECVIQLGESNFYPALSFSGDDLDTLLVQATWGWVAMSTIAKDVASLPGVVQVRDEETGEWRVDRKAAPELWRVLDRPFGTAQDAPPWGWGQLIETASLHLDICGNAFLRKVLPVTGGERLIGLQLIKPTIVDVTTYPNGVARLYSVGGADGRQLTPDQVVNVMNISAGSYWQGISTLSAATDAIQVDDQASKRIRYDLTNRLAPGVILKVRNHFGLTDDQRTKINDYLTEQFGKAELSGKPLIVGEQTEIEEYPQTNITELPEHRRNARDEVLSIWNIPPLIAGVTDNATLQFSSVALQLYWMQALGPRIGRILGAVNTQAITPIYGPNVRLWYELNDNALGLAILDSRAQVAKTLHRDLDYSTNDSAARVSLNMPKHPALDAMNTQAIVAGRDDVNETGSDGRSA